MRKQDSMKENKALEMKTDQKGLQVMELSETDFKVILYNINVFKEIKNEIENFNRELEPIMK